MPLSIDIVAYISTVHQKFPFAMFRSHLIPWRPYLVVLLAVPYTILASSFPIVFADQPAAEHGFPVATSKKGLQVEDCDDAIQLGVQHATFNVMLPQLLTKTPSEISLPGAQGTYWVNVKAIRSLDQKIRSLSHSGVLVYLILLNPVRSGVDPVWIHPNYDQKNPNGYSAFSIDNASARDQLECLIRFLANRYGAGDPHRPQSFDYGRVVGYIIGNEVNSHWWWHNRGDVPIDQFVADYAREVAIITRAVESHSPWARTYVSLEHHWTASHQPKSPNRCFGAKEFLLKFAEECRKNGDFRWHIAFHPYPENLFDPTFWDDARATESFDTPKLTFRNLAVLRDFLRQPQFLDRSLPRSIILSEQGFHWDTTDRGEQLQAAAYCYAFKIVDSMQGIDSFILHRHIDHPREGGLNLGLYKNTEGDKRIAKPESARLIRHCFQAAATSEQEEAFRFALPIVGLESWPTGD
jgi:hypothetical protein